jgi:hypothetical protein
MKVFAKATPSRAGNSAPSRTCRFPNQWHARYEQLEQHKIDGTMEYLELRFQAQLGSRTAQLVQLVGRALLTTC